MSATFLQSFQFLLNVSLIIRSVKCQIQSLFYRLRVSFSRRRLSYWPDTDTATLWAAGVIGGLYELACDLPLLTIPLFTGLLLCRIIRLGYRHCCGVCASWASPVSVIISFTH